MRAEGHCNPCLHIKDRRDIWPAISRVAGCHLPRCLACGLQCCQMGIMRLQDAFQEASEAPKLQGQNNFFFKSYTFSIIIYQSFYICHTEYASCSMSSWRFYKALFKRPIAHFAEKVIALAPETFRS